MGEASREILRKARKQVPEWAANQVHDELEQKGSTRGSGFRPG